MFDPNLLWLPVVYAGVIQPLMSADAEAARGSLGLWPGGYLVSVRVTLNLAVQAAQVRILIYLCGNYIVGSPFRFISGSGSTNWCLFIGHVEFDI